VDLGVLNVEFGGKKKMQHKIRIVWQIDEVMPNNKPFIASKRYTLSLHEKATLRKDLESWRGRPFTDAESEGFDVESVLHVPAFLNIIEEKKDGKTYSNVVGIMKLPKQMGPPVSRDYIRVCDREVAPTQADSTLAPPPDFEGITDDDVPFS
jgi:hypothetical protein